MKGIACGICCDLRALSNGIDLYEWTACRCGNVEGRWEDPGKGIAVFRAKDRVRAFGVGFNNHFLVPALQGRTAMFSDARALHDLATTAPNHVFDKSRAGCWAIVFKPGSTNDTSWEDWLEETQS